MHISCSDVFRNMCLPLYISYRSVYVFPVFTSSSLNFIVYPIPYFCFPALSPAVSQTADLAASRTGPRHYATPRHNRPHAPPNHPPPFPPPPPPPPKTTKNKNLRRAARHADTTESADRQAPSTCVAMVIAPPDPFGTNRAPISQIGGRFRHGGGGRAPGAAQSRFEADGPGAPAAQAASRAITHWAGQGRAASARTVRKRGAAAGFSEIAAEQHGLAVRSSGTAPGTRGHGRRPVLPTGVRNGPVRRDVPGRARRVLVVGVTPLRARTPSSAGTKTPS
jgi:hypothetical protein